jgi:hypothetical protein
VSIRSYAVPLDLWLTRAQAESLACHGAGNGAKPAELLATLKGLPLQVGDRVLLAYERDDKKYDVLASAVVQDLTEYAWTKTGLLFAMPIEGLSFKARVLTEAEAQRLDDELKGASVASTNAVLSVPEVKQAASQLPLGLRPTGTGTKVAESKDDSEPPMTSDVAPRWNDPGLPETDDDDHDPRNIILFGPPGTGKTHATTRRALELLRVKSIPEGEAAHAVCFRRFQDAGRIEFVTFHQSYGYEDFVEGLRPVLKGDSVAYEIHAGVLKRIARDAMMAAADAQRRRTIPAAGMADFDKIWKLVLSRFSTPGIRPSLTVQYQVSAGDAGNLSLRKYYADTQEVGDNPISAPKDAMRSLWAKRETLGENADTGAFRRETRISNCTGIWVAWRELWRAARELANLSQPPPMPQFVLIIDEINRGNISKILGELITLLEPDKRLGMPNELRLKLAYSPDELFGLPPNLHILGTMNTADRSIALIDVALRRRFSFEHIGPDVTALQRIVDTELSSLASRLLTTINERVRYLLDADHEIGHAYLLKVTKLAELRDVFVRRVIPLLFEYFHGSPHLVASVLGCAADTKGEPRRERAKSGPILTARLDHEKVIFDTKEDDEDIEDTRLTYSINAKFIEATEDELRPYFNSILKSDS